MCGPHPAWRLRRQEDDQDNGEAQVNAVSCKSKAARVREREGLEGILGLGEGHVSGSELVTLGKESVTPGGVCNAVYQFGHQNWPGTGFAVSVSKPVEMTRRLEDTWRDREGCVEMKQSREGAGYIRQGTHHTFS
jgi:hypothetical protein